MLNSSFYSSALTMLHHSISNYKFMCSLHQAFWLTTELYELVTAAHKCNLLLRIDIIICTDSYYSSSRLYFFSRLSNKTSIMCKASIIINAWSARKLYTLKSYLNRLKIELNSSSLNSDVLHFFTKTVQISKVFSSLIWVLTAWFEFYVIMYIFELTLFKHLLFDTFALCFDHVCTNEYIIKLIYTKIVHIWYKIALINSFL